MNSTNSGNDQLPGITINRIVMPSLYIVKTTLTSIPILWLPILFFLGIEFLAGYADKPPFSVKQIYIVPIVKSLFIFTIFGFLLRDMIRTKSVRLTPAFPYPYLLAMAMLWLVFCVATSLPRLATDSLIFVRLVLLQLIAVLVILPLFFGSRAVFSSLVLYGIISVCYWYLNRLGLFQNHWLFSNTKAVYDLLFTFTCFVVTFLFFEYLTGGRFRSIASMSNPALAPSFGGVENTRKTRLLESIQQEKFNRWPLWRKLSLGVFPPSQMQILLPIVANGILFLILVLYQPDTAVFCGWTFIFVITSMSWCPPMAKHPFRAQCRRLYLQCREDSKALFFQHYFAAGIIRLLPVLLITFIFAAAFSVIFGENYWWVLIFSLIGFLLGLIGETQLEISNERKSCVVNAIWVAVSFVICVISYIFFWRDDAVGMSIFTLVILLLALLLYGLTKKYSTADFEF